MLVAVYREIKIGAVNVFTCVLVISSDTYCIISADFKAESGNIVGGAFCAYCDKILFVILFGYRISFLDEYLISGTCTAC